MIVAHHGQYDYGSPAAHDPRSLGPLLPDNLTPLFSFHQQLRNDPNAGSPWTHYNQNMGRKLFKGYGERDGTPR